MTARVRSSVTIGNFDGVHRGHLALIDRATRLAAEGALRSVAVTFDPHPAAVLRPEAVPSALQSIDERVALLRAHGMDEVVVIPFDERLAAQRPEHFVTEFLVERLDAAVVVVGENFRFGAGASGDVSMLSMLGAEHGFSVEPVGLVDDEGHPISSSAIRALLATGDLEAVSRALGRSFTLTGTVVRGEGRGRTLGVPTANVAVDPGRALPADGVYACWAWPDGAVIAPPGATVPDDPGRVAAVVNVGWRPTFDGTSRTVEAHLLLDGPEDGPQDGPAGSGPDLYERRLTLAFQARIRGEERFDGPEALIGRIREDIAVAHGLLQGP
jgi:riboflavin kinase/FMN adenylyltransferase